MPEGLRQRYMSVGEATASNLTFLLKEYADHSASAGMRRKFHWPPPPPLRTVGLYQFVRTRFMYVVHPADANVWKLLSPEPSAPRVTHSGRRTRERARAIEASEMIDKPKPPRLLPRPRVAAAGLVHGT